MSRSLKKPLYTLGYYCKRIYNKFLKANKEGKQLDIKIHCRAAVIDPVIIGHIVRIHMGNGYAKRLVVQDMVGYKFGEFAPTRKSGLHGKAGRH